MSKIYPDQAVIIRADRAAKYESVVTVIDTCRKAGVWNFSLSTSNEDRAE
ncbi:MAG: biopolymer transporter ExbD [Kiritimatiellae bacterium]|nr:biopolymer transporter ExbD [Kiritimatiellia bacterium]